MLQLDLDGGGHLVVERAYGLEEVIESEDLGDDDEDAGDLRHRGRSLLQHAVDVGESAAVDHPVDELGRRDLPVQGVLRDQLSVLLDQGIGEVGAQFPLHPLFVGNHAVEDLIGRMHLGVGQQNGQLWRDIGAELTIGQFLRIGQELDLTIEVGVLLQVAQHPAVGARHRFGLCACLAEDDVLGVVVRQHPISNIIGEGQEHSLAILGGEGTLVEQGAQEQLDVDLVVGAVHTCRVVDGVGVDRHTVQCRFDTSQLGHTEVAALSDDPAAHVATVDADGVIGLVPDIGVALIGGLDVGSDSSVVDEVDRGFEDLGHQFGGAALAGLESQNRGGLGAEVDRLRRPGEDSAPVGDELPVVVLPAGARQVEETFALDEAACGIRVRIEEDVSVVEGRDEPDVLAAQHSVAEYVTAHVTDSHDLEVVGRGVDPELTEVSFDGLPCTAGGDGHLLVVVADGAAGGEGVAEPEVAAFGNRVGHVREACRALVRGDDEVVVIAVVSDHTVRVDDLLGAVGAVDEIVGNLEKAFDEDLVGGLTGGHPRIAVAHRRQLLGEESALGAGRNDERVLNHLSLDETEDLGAEVITTIRPPQAAAGHCSKAQVHALNLRRVHPHLQGWLRLGHEAEVVGADLEYERCRQFAVFAQEVVRPHCGAQQFERGPQDTVRVEAGDIAECRLDRGVEFGHPVIASGIVGGGVELREEVVHQQA